MAPEPRYSPNATLTPDQHHILSLLAEGHSITEAAAQVGIHRNTVGNWRRTIPAFAREHQFAIREQAMFWHDRAVQLAPRAAQVLDEILDDPATSPALRLRAALAILKEAASPQLEPLHNLHNESLTHQQEAHHDSEPIHLPATTPDEIVQQNENPRSCTILHNAHRSLHIPPIRRAPGPGRNSQCPCGSGQKYKRCCASYAPPRAATAVAA